jgi:hypothetical protein
MNSEIDLPGEFIAARSALTLDHRKRLKAAGVPSFLVDVSGFVGMARIVETGNKFLFAPDGVEAFLIPVRVDPEAPTLDIDHPVPTDALLYGDTLDIVAFDLDRPDWWATLTGLAPTLGYAVFADTDTPTQVWRGPLAWLQARCRGIVPLAHDDTELRAILHRLPCGIQAQDIEHGLQLERVLTRPLPALEIFVGIDKAAA